MILCIKLILHNLLYITILLPSIELIEIIYILGLKGCQQLPTYWTIVLLTFSVDRNTFRDNGIQVTDWYIELQIVTKHWLWLLSNTTGDKCGTGDRSSVCRVPVTPVKVVFLCCCCCCCSDVCIMFVFGFILLTIAVYVFRLLCATLVSSNYFYWIIISMHDH